jgi:hypothetical protein
MSKECIAGVSYSGGVAHLAVFEIRERETKLLHLEEFINAGQNPLWFLEYILEPKTRILKKIEKVSVGLDMADVLLHQFPLDTTLSKVEQNEHVHWELSNLVEGYQAKDYLYDLHVMKADAQSQVAEVMAVAVRQLYIYKIQEHLEHKKIALHIVDGAYFGGEKTLLLNFPEVKSKSVVLLYCSHNRIDIGLEIGGHLARYRYGINTNPQGVIDLVKETISDTTLNEIYCCGPAVPSDIKMPLQESLGYKVLMVNPFRQMITTSSFLGYDVFSGLEHRFAGAVGLALHQE